MRFLLFLIIGYLFLPQATQAKTYFVKLTPAGLQKRAQLVNNTLPAALAKPATSLFKNIIPAKMQPVFLRRWLQMEIRNAQDKAYWNSLKQKNLIEKTEPVGYFKIHSFTNDSLIDRQWYLSEIGIPQAWQITSGDSSVIVGVIDTGVDYKHPDLQANIWRNLAELHGKPGVDDDHNGYVDDVYGWDFTDAPNFADGGDYLNPDPDPMDEFSGGHGTEIAGIIAAVRNNHIGISGIAPKVKIMVLRAGTASGYLEEDDVIRALFYALNNGARIVNMSFGDTNVSTLFHDVLHYLWQKGLVLISAAGNSGSNQVFYPAGFSETIAVGASDQNGRLAGFSNFGPVLDVLAPGSEILSTAPQNHYAVVNGTSFGAPIVSAEAALLLAHWPQLNNEQIRTIIKGSASGHTVGNHQIGSGVVNVFNALKIGKKGELRIDSPPPQSSVAGNLLPIIGTAYHPDLKNVQLRYGIGINPQQWHMLLSSDFHFFLSDTLAVLNLATLPDTTVLLHLSMELLNGQQIDITRLVTIDRTAPRFLSVQLVPAYQGTEQNILIKIVSDDPSVLHAEFFDAFKRNKTNYSVDRNDFSRKHFIKISKNQIGNADKVVFTLQNASGLKSVSQEQTIVFPSSFRFTPWENVGHVLPSGYLLPFTTDFNKNGLKEIVLSQYGDHQAFGPVHIYEFSNGRFVDRFATGKPFIPRDVGDINGDGQNDLLLGFGPCARILAGRPGAFPQKILWEDSSFWAAKICDVDRDGLGEVIGYRDSVYQILEWNGHGEFDLVASLPNPTKGENRLGVPFVLIRDVTGDGNPEIIFGDTDGDIIVYSCTGNNRLELLGTAHASLSDATDLLCTLDDQILVLSHSPENQNLESEWVRRYWSLDAFQWVARQKTFRQTLLNGFYPYFPKKNFASGLQSYRFADQQWLFVSTYPYLYFFKRNTGQNWQAVWSNPDCRSNTVVVDDLNRDSIPECYFNTSRGIVAYTQQSVRRPASPVNCRAQALDSLRVRISWQGTEEADAYLIYRGTSQSNLQIIAQTPALTFLDSLPQMNRWYYYAVTALDSSQVYSESAFSNLDSTRTGYPPRLLSAEQESERQVILHFDQPMRIINQASPAVYLNNGRAKARSVTLLSQTESILAVFGQDIPSYPPSEISVVNLFGKNGIPVDRRFSMVPLQPMSFSEGPIVSHIRILDRSHVQLDFSQPMDKQSLLNVDHYRLTPSGRVVKVILLDSSAQKVQLQLSQTAQAGGFGRNVCLTLNGLRNRQGVEITGPLQLNLFRPVNDLTQLVIYPQPVRPEHKQLIFAKLPQNTQIQIFTLNGQRVRSFYKTNDNGGVVWDLRDQNGRRVGSGIYFYRIECHGKERIGKLVIVR